GKLFFLVMNGIKENAGVGRRVTARLPIRERPGMTRLAGIMKGKNVLLGQPDRLVWVAGEMLHHAVDVGAEGMDVERERAAVAIAAMHRGMCRVRPRGVDGGHLVTRGAGVAGVGVMKVRQAAQAGSHDKKAGQQSEIEHEEKPALHDLNLLAFQSALMWWET